MANKQKHSIEELVEQWAKEQLNGIKLYAKNDFINAQIEKALKTALSKNVVKVPIIRTLNASSHQPMVIFP